MLYRKKLDLISSKCRSCFKEALDFVFIKVSGLFIIWLFWIWKWNLGTVYFAYYIILFTLILLCFYYLLRGVCGLDAPVQVLYGSSDCVWQLWNWMSGEKRRWLKKFFWLLFKFIRCLEFFTFRYYSLNLEDSFVHFWFAKYLFFLIFKSLVWKSLEVSQADPDCCTHGF